MINALIQAIDAQLTARYSTVTVRSNYEDLQKKPPSPSIEIETTGGDIQPDRGDGKLYVQCLLAFHVIGSFKTHDESLTRALAFDVAHFTHRRNWLPGSDLATVSSVVRDEFSSEADEFSVWRVESSVVISLGENTFDYSLLLAPDQVLASTTPEIGIPHEHEYEPIVDVES